MKQKKLNKKERELRRKIEILKAQVPVNHTKKSEKIAESQKFILSTKQITQEMIKTAVFGLFATALIIVLKIKL